jgi:hypothetical protein
MWKDSYLCPTFPSSSGYENYFTMMGANNTNFFISQLLEDADRTNFWNGVISIWNGRMLIEVQKITLNFAVAVLLSQTAPSIITCRYHTTMTCCFCTVNISYIEKYMEWKLWHLWSTTRGYMHRMGKSKRRWRKRRRCTRSVYLAVFIKTIKCIYRLQLSILVL